VSLPAWEERLAQVTALAGVRGAVVVSAEDGLAVYESAVEGLDPSDVAALATAVVQRVEELARTLGHATLGLCTLAADRGTVLAAPGRDGMWFVVLADPGAELGRLRLLVGDLAPEFA
jgi:predicted regulator of Ras-like GTPase activity (Roadblock/LC7/MglB family)